MKYVFTVIAASLFTFLLNLKQRSSRSEEVCCKNRDNDRGEENTVLVSCILLRRPTFSGNTWQIWISSCFHLMHRCLTKIRVVMSKSLISKAVGSEERRQVLKKQWVSWKCVAKSVSLKFSLFLLMIQVHICPSHCKYVSQYAVCLLTYKSRTEICQSIAI